MHVHHSYAVAPGVMLIFHEKIKNSIIKAKCLKFKNINLFIYNIYKIYLGNEIFGTSLFTKY